MGKLSYVVKRIANMNFKTYFKTIEDVHKKTNKPRIYIFFDSICCGIAHEAGYMDYQLFEMYKMNHKERKTVLTRGRNNALMKKYNNPAYVKYFGDKALFNEKFNKYLNRDWLLLKNDNFEDFQKFIKEKKEIIVKPLDESCGKGVEKIKVRDYDAKELFEQLLSNKQYLVEEVATQCKTISNLHPASINTVRVVTLKGRVVFACLRIGNYNNVVDNFNNGGMVAPIDIKTGQINYPAIDKVHNEYLEHPLTKKKIVGLKIPMWDKIVSLCEEASNVIPELGYLGWDVCVGEKTPFLIEGNEFPGHDLYQLPPHRDKDEGIYPEFLKALEDRK